MNEVAMKWMSKLKKGGRGVDINSRMNSFSNRSDN